MLLPFVAVLLASRDARDWLRGTGSIKQTLSNAGVGVLFLLSQLFLRGVLLSAFALVASLVPWKLPSTPWSFALAFLLLDAIYYLQHRMEHQVPLLWAIHSVHHQSKDYNLSVSFRVGMLASCSTLVFHALLALFGVSAAMYAVVVTVHGVLLFGLHARTKFTLGPGRFFNAPVFHRVHHGADAEYIDKNFGGVLLVFDRIFGTFTPYIPRAEGDQYGVAGEPSLRNPLLANVTPIADLAKRVSAAGSFSAKLRVLFVRS